MWQDIGSIPRVKQEWGALLCELNLLFPSNRLKTEHSEYICTCLPWMRHLLLESCHDLFTRFWWKIIVLWCKILLISHSASLSRAVKEIALPFFNFSYKFFGLVIWKLLVLSVMCTSLTFLNSIYNKGRAFVTWLIERLYSNWCMYNI